MLKHVSPGDEITAEGFNSLVDAVGGPDIPTQKGFVKTADGAIFTEWSSLDAQANMRAADAFKCAVGPAVRTATTAGPWDNWNIPRGGEPESTLKHIYMYLGANNLNMLQDSPIQRNPFLNFNGLPPKYIAWSLLADNHIVSDKDFYVNNLDSDFDGNGVLDSSVQPNIYHGWIETPFEPIPGAKIYGAFYKLLDSSGEGELVGTMFILTYAGENPDTGTAVFPIHSFTTFIGPKGENFVVGEQCTTPVLICEMQAAQAMPGSQDATMESSKLVQHFTGPLSYQHAEQEVQGAWSVINFVSGNEHGDDIEIKSYFEMKLSNASQQHGPIYPDFEIKQNVAGKSYLCINNFQASGRQTVVELDSSSPVKYGVLSEDDFPSEGEQALPFVNICKNPKGFLDVNAPYDAYLVIPQSLTLTSTKSGMSILSAFLRGIFTWIDTLKCWELMIMEGERIKQGALNDVLLAECRFDGTGTYTWFVPRNAIFQGSFSNMLRDWNIGDAQLGLEIEQVGPVVEKLTYNASIDACNILSAVDEEGNSIYEPTDAFNQLSAAHPLGLQLYRFDKMDYTTPLSVGLTSAELSAEWIGSMDVVVRHRHFDQNDRKEGFKGSVIKYVPINDLLSAGLSAALVSGDTDITQSTVPSSYPNTSSIETKQTLDGKNYLQLHGFKGAAADYSPANADAFHGSSGQGGFVVRQTDGNGGMYVSYMDPHALSNLVSADAKTDTQLTEGDFSSWHQPMQMSIDGKHGYLELYQFNGSSMFNPASLSDFSSAYDAIVVRRAGAPTYVDYMKPSALSNLVPIAPSLSALDHLSVVTGIEYPMSGENQYKIVAHRKEVVVANSTIQLNNLPDQTIDTVPHSGVI